jgi:hypothetical protein
MEVALITLPNLAVIIEKAVSMLFLRVVKTEELGHFFRNSDKSVSLEKMEKLFITNSTLVRNNRSSPRYDYEKTKHLRNALNYHKRRKKIVF